MVSDNFFGQVAAELLCILHQITLHVPIIQERTSSPHQNAGLVQLAVRNSKLSLTRVQMFKGIVLELLPSLLGGKNKDKNPTRYVCVCHRYGSFHEFYFSIELIVLIIIQNYGKVNNFT